MANLTQVQQAVNYVNGYATAMNNGGDTPALPSGLNGNNIIAIILQALGYYTGAVTGTLSTAVGSPLTTAYIQFHNAVFGGNSPVSSTPLTSFGGPPAIYPALAHVASQALAAASAGTTPGAGGAAPATTSSGASSYSTQPYGGETYTVKSGDTLSAIASMYGVSLSALEAANPQITNPDLIYVGEVINIPATMTSVAVPTAGTPPISQDGGEYTQSGSSSAPAPASSGGGITDFLSSTGGKIAAAVGLVGLALAFKRKS